MKLFEDDNYMRSMLLLFRTERSLNGPADAQHRGYQLPAGATTMIILYMSLLTKPRELVEI